MSSESLKRLSIVTYMLREPSGSCGYCKSENDGSKHGLWAHRLDVQDYQDLIDRGWRRCSHYCYRPIMSEICCPMYTIRCAARDFRLSRSQKRILKKMSYFLMTGDKGSCRKKHTAEDNAMEFVAPVFPAQELQESQMKNLLKKSTMMTPMTSYPKSEISLTSGTKNVSKKDDSFVIPISKREGPSLKKKHIRINRKLEKLRMQGLSDEEISKKMIEKKKYPVTKTLEDHIAQPLPPNAAHRLEVRLVRSSPPSLALQQSASESYNLYKRYQIAVHLDPPHKVSEQSYERFLVKSPLEAFGRYGSFHQQYWLDGKLIAVGVLDILPRCVSSVYFFYDPDYAFLSLGTYGALRELALTRALSKENIGLEYYYMGYYIHSCPKMRYKAAFKPSFLLCPEMYSWQPIETCLPKLDISKYSKLDPRDGNEEVDKFDISQIRIFNGRQYINLGDFDSIPSSLSDINEYVELVGTLCARRMIIYVG